MLNIGLAVLSKSVLMATVKEIPLLTGSDGLHLAWIK
jgi:hypothetical protein